ncbi:periplasmic chaperone for outer membrane proteins Skp [Pseudidiomarina planktonica]|uniref:Periplasmic chaperone for outer membrane proteins Skp n=1 Tax=Pseudidiomarina planktonica TaxID=1323738 RepID=A0A1Y6ETG3_9GAMM|nr:OmpH family outer membrane protein [Pseudidiomarina planktonica]RUO65550.1 molecular chaperone [Pseudidiomarina planktonica]SMQ64501.1 periplasmic chaperone for outer membrane proteins Skp [Pseudidiomarina planktonica]
MNKLIKNSLIALTMSAAMLTTAAQAQQRIGVVDVMRVFQELPQREQIAEQLQGEFQERFEEMRRIETRVNELRAKQQRDASIMSDAEKTQVDRELETLAAEAQLKGKALNEDTRRRQNEERNRLLMEVQQVIDKIAKDEGFDIVLQSNAVAYISDSADLSDEVIQAMTSGQ